VWVKSPWGNLVRPSAQIPNWLTLRHLTHHEFAGVTHDTHYWTDVHPVSILSPLSAFHIWTWFPMMYSMYFSLWQAVFFALLVRWKMHVVRLPTDLLSLIVCWSQVSGWYLCYSIISFFLFQQENTVTLFLVVSLLVQRLSYSFGCVNLGMATFRNSWACFSQL
jgi:hypothetical protein